MADNHVHLPTLLRPDAATADIAKAAAELEKYYGSRYAPSDRTPKTGAWFDDFDPSGTRASSPDEITADDLLSLSLLSTPVRGDSAVSILGPMKERISALLSQIPVNETLATHTEELSAQNFPAWRLENLLREVPGIGLTRATKLIARKRPHLYPILDSVVIAEIGTHRKHLNPIREAFQDPDLIERIRAARDAAKLPESISDLRIFDVIAWMQGVSKGADPEKYDAPSDDIPG